MKNILLAALLFCSFFSYGQIMGPDTVCAGTSYTFGSADSSLHYAWDTVAVNICPGVPTNSTLQFSGSNNTVCYRVVYDNATGNFYGFNVRTNNLDRYVLGSDPMNPTPTQLGLGNFFGTLTSNATAYIDVVRDTTGLWYGFITDGGHLVRIDFGNSLGNTVGPGDIHSMTIASNNLAQVTLIRYLGNWLAFVGNTSGTGGTIGYVTKVDFGADITNSSPTITNLPTGAGAFSNPNYFALYNDKVQGTWHMLVQNRGQGLNSNGLSRYDFGSNLNNNNPTATGMGDFGGVYTSVRGITIIEGCDSFYALGLFGSGPSGGSGVKFAHISFNNGTSTNILNTPSITDLGSLGLNNSKGSLTTFWHSTATDDSLYLTYSASFTGGIYTSQCYGMSGSGQVSYTPQANWTFAPGTHNIRLFCDQGHTGHRGFYCNKTIYAVAPGVPQLGNDTTACAGDSVILAPLVVGTGTPSFLWSNGATTPSIAVKSGGAFSVNVSGLNLCTTGQSNTVIVAFVTKPVVDLGHDTTICSSTPITLQAAGTFPPQVVYSWSTTPTQTTPSISVSQSGTYTLTISNGGCSGSGTVNITANPSPTVNLGNDTTFCEGYVEVINSSQPIGSTFLWNDGTVDSTIYITKAGTYKLTVTYAGCSTTDSITIAVSPAPVISLGNDTTICDNIPITLGATHPSATSYIWSTDSTLVVYPTTHAYADSMRELGPTDAFLTTRSGGIFSLTVVAQGGCAFTDSISIISQPGPHINFNVDRHDTICKDKPYIIDPGFTTSGYTYLWNTGATTQTLKINVSGDYWLTVKTANKCAATDTVSIKMITAPDQGILGNDTTLCNDQQIMIPPFIDSSLHIKWYENEFDVAHFTDSVLYRKVHDQPGLYIAVVSNKCGTTIDSITVTNKFCNLWFPNVFTPNNDGVNDILKPQGDLSMLANYTLTIYNRWGVLLFTSTNPYVGWSGKYNDIQQPAGVYLYQMQFNFRNMPYTQHGNFTLLR